MFNVSLSWKEVKEIAFKIIIMPGRQRMLMDGVTSCAGKMSKDGYGSIWIAEKSI